MSLSHPSSRRFGFSMIGLLVTMVCIVVLFSLLMTSLNKAVTGQGSQQPGTVRSFEDKMFLKSLFDSMMTAAGDSKGMLPTPGSVSGGNDPSQDTTANLYSALVMKQFTNPHQLISGNEYSGYVEEDKDYDFTAYQPAQRVFWDQNFKADLKKLSHVSFAHEPLFGARFKNHWNNSLSSTFPVLGNRGPKDGIEDPTSLAYGRNGQWGGHMVFGDGHVDFFTTFTPPGVIIEQNGKVYSDNVYNMDSGPNGDDAVLSFTKIMGRNGPELQYD